MFGLFIPVIASVSTVSINKFAYNYSFNKKMASIDDTCSYETY